MGGREDGKRGGGGCEGSGGSQSFTLIPPSLVFTLLVPLRFRLFSLFDELADRLGVQKVETAGDCYIVAAGILTLDAEGYSEV